VRRPPPVRVGADGPGRGRRAPPPPPLERSLFARDPNGALTEDALQQILASPIELDLPARVGVVPIVTATDWRGPNPDYLRVPAGVAPFVQQAARQRAVHAGHRDHADPVGGAGHGGAARGRGALPPALRGLYREVIATKSTVGKIAWFYATLVGTAFVPGQDHAAYGYVEASMFDVKTGLFLFTTRRSVLGTPARTCGTRTTSWRALAPTLAVPRRRAAGRRREERPVPLRRRRPGREPAPRPGGWRADRPGRGRDRRVSRAARRSRPHHRGAPIRTRRARVCTS
jgi:hypothetical protein